MYPAPPSQPALARSAATPAGILGAAGALTGATAAIWLLVYRIDLTSNEFAGSYYWYYAFSAGVVAALALFGLLPFAIRLLGGKAGPRTAAAVVGLAGVVGGFQFDNIDISAEGTWIIRAVLSGITVLLLASAGILAVFSVRSGQAPASRGSAVPPPPPSSAPGFPSAPRSPAPADPTPTPAPAPPRAPDPAPTPVAIVKQAEAASAASGAPSPGWYDDAEGTTRWWDGTRWTEQTWGASGPAPGA